MKIYGIIIVVIFPSMICLIINLIIFKHVHSSSNRVRPIFQITRNNSNNIPLGGITRRDVHLLKHIILMFCIFIGGWSPIFIVEITQPNLSINSLAFSLIILLSELALLLDIVYLFVYNHKLRRYLQNKIFICK
jgi:hypothetical protein